LADGFDCAPLDAAAGSVGLVETMTLTESAGTMQLVWTAAARAESYDVQRGTLAELAEGTYGQCVSSQQAATAYDDPEIPAADEGFFYLVRGYDAGCGAGGSLGTDSAGTPRTPACP
jgi:hypothetical protein